MGNCIDIYRVLFITDEGGHGLWRLRLVERLCAAHGEPIDDLSGNRTPDGTVPNVTPRVWTMADPANATAPIPADAIDRMVRCLGAFQLFLFPYLYGRLVSDVVFCLSLPLYRGARVGGYERDESAQAMAQSPQTRPRRGHILREVPQPH